jgi:peroxiredoxin Q/BCP
MKLLTDGDGSVRRAYGVRPTLGLFPGRVTFVVDRTGVIRHQFASQLRVVSHVQQALSVVRGLAKDSPAS